MTKEHKKLYKAGKNWVVATLTATTITLLGGIGAYTAHADTTIENTQSIQVEGSNQSSQNNNSNNPVVLNQPVTTQSNSTVKNSQPVQNTPTTLTVTAATNNSSELDPNIYGTVNVKDWDYQENNNIFNLTGYHGAYNHIILPNLNDFNNAGVNVNGATGVGITSNVLRGILCDAKNPDADLNLAISKTTGIYNDKVIAENENWAGVFCLYNLTYENGEPVLSGTEQFTLVNADLSNLDTNKVTNIAHLFHDQHKLQTVSGLNNWNTSKVTDMSYVFGACWALNNVGDLSSWDTSNVTNMAGMFGSSGLSDLTMIKDWNTSKVQSLEGMFRMMNLTALDLSRWDTSQVTNMSDMFDNLRLPIDLSKLNTSKVTDMSFMFFAAHVANIKGFENWDTSNVRTMKAMFRDSEVENLLSISNWDTSKVEDMSSMFMGTQNLKQLDLTKWDCSSLTNVGNSYRDAMFGDSNLSFYIVLNRSKNNPNEITLYDPYGLMGNRGTIIAEIKAPTFYQQVAGKSENDIIIETITPIVEAYAKNEYTNFYMHLNPGMKEIYPTSANIKLASYVDPSNLYSAVNCQFDYTTKIGKLKDVVINYYDQDRNLIKTDYFTGVIGKTMQVPYTMPDGYMLLDGEQIPKSITFKEGKLQTIDVYLKEAPVTKQVVVNYVDVNGQTVKSNSLSGNIGETISLNLSLPEGYELVDGQSIPSSITLKENENQTITVKVTKAPAVKTGSINYVDQDGKVIKTDTISGKVGDKVDVKLSLPDGYELANKDEHIPSVITVTENGIGTINVNVKKINTTLANNEVPYDSTTISNNVNANYGYLDSYKLTENNQGQAQLIASGWHATGASNSDRYRYMIVFDNTLGHEIARQKLVPQVRSDVQRAYSNVDNSLYSGFNVTIDIPNSCINHSLRLVSRYSNDPNNGEGARVDYWFNSLALNEDNQAYLDKLSANGDTLTVTGWHATNQAAGRPYHYIIAWDQNLGHEIARQKVTAVSRPDVDNAYSTVANAVNSGFSVKFNLTPQFFNDNIQFISRWTDDAAGNGNAVDYWFKAMNRENRANLDSVTLSNGQVQVAGWHATDLSQLEPNHYLIVFDNTTGQQVASEKVDLLSSQDVKNVFGDIQTADHSRFNYTFNSLHLISGHHYSLVSRYSADANGNGNDGAHTDSWLNMGTFQQSAYSIDHVALNRRHMTVQGWVANDNAMTRPYAYAILLQNSHEIGRQRLNLSERADVAKVYPQIYRSQYSGFNTSFDLPTASTNGLQLVLRFTDDPAGNGNSSDKWINL